MHGYGRHPFAAAKIFLVKFTSNLQTFNTFNTFFSRPSPPRPEPGEVS